MFTNIAREDILNLYALYQSEEYDIFFRHYEDFMNLDEFSVAIAPAKWLVFPEGYISLIVHPKPKLCQISILIIKEHQRQGLGFKYMVEIGKYLFSNGINRVIVNVVETDLHTKNMCDKGGFELEGRHIFSCKIDGVYYTELRYGMSKDKYQEIYGG